MVINTLLSLLGAEQNRRTAEPVVYFYCNQNEPQRRDPTAILQAILKQLCVVLPQAGLPAPVVAAYDERCRNGLAAGSLEFQECLDLLVLLLYQHPHTTIIIDALDESDPMERWRLLEALAKCTQESSVKIFISSRDDTDIKFKLENVPNLYIEVQDNMDDIRRFIHREVKLSVGKRRLWRLPDHVQTQILSTILQKANGM